jgi:alcohol dehydrogenase
LIAGHEIDPGQFVTHRFSLDEFEAAYDTFARPGETGALKVVLTRA